MRYKHFIYMSIYKKPDDYWGFNLENNDES